MADDLVPTRTRPRRTRRKVYLASASALIIAAGALVAAWRREKPIPITTEKAIRISITQLVTATGKIQPAVEVKISPEVSGEIIDLPVKEGQLVHKGDLLLHIKPDSYKAQVEEQEAALRSARAAAVQHRAELAKADSDYHRAMELFKEQLIAESDRKAAQTSADVAQAALQSSLFEIERSAGALRQIRDLLTKTTIVSPSEGVITSLSSRLGERVVGTSQFPGTEVMRIADLGDMEAQVDVNENDVVNVKLADVARISIDAYPDRRVEGVVRDIAASATTKNAGTQEQVTTFLVKIHVTDHSLRLRPGMSATADIQTATVKDVVAVPIQSVTVRRTDSSLSPEELERRTARQGGDQGDNRAQVTNETLEKQKERLQRERLQRVVFVKEGNAVRQRRVETGIADAARIEIRAGVQPGEEIVSGSYTAISRKLKDGARVEIEKEKG
jgi:HlyD family secretion protein